MASTDYVAVSWNPGQLVDEDTLDQMNNNITYLKNQMIDGKYTQLNGGLVDINLKMLCGRNIITARKSATATITVNFASMFSSTCTPIVTTSLVSPSQDRIFTIVNGIGQLHPSNHGFQVTVDAALTTGADTGGTIAKDLYINWIAMGF
jgi:hypothetical protein